MRKDNRRLQSNGFCTYITLIFAFIIIIQVFDGTEGINGTTTVAVQNHLRTFLGVGTIHNSLDIFITDC